MNKLNQSFKEFMNESLSTTSLTESADYSEAVRAGLVQAFNKFSLKDITVNFDFAKRADLLKLVSLDKNDEVKFDGFVTKGEGNKSVPTISQKFKAEAVFADPSEGEGVIVYVNMVKNGLNFSEAQNCDLVATKISLEKFENIDTKFSLFIHTKDGKYQGMEMGG
jgi:hypothetical protein